MAKPLRKKRRLGPVRTVAREGASPSTAYERTSVEGHAVLHQGDHHGHLVHNHYYASQVPTQDEIKQKELHASLVNTLHFNRMDARLLSVKAALPQTCAWLFEHDSFKAWLAHVSSDDTGFLWLKGKPGCGKSTIMKHALHHVNKLTQSDALPCIVFSYFFNARSPHPLEKSFIGLLRSLVHMTLTNLPELVPLFYHKFSTRLWTDEADDWTEAELRDFLFHDVIESPHTANTSLCLFVDALDEGEIDDIRNMLDFLDDLVVHSALNNRNIRVCFSSRHYPQILFDRAVSIVIEDQTPHDEDIRLYIHKKLNSSLDEGMEELRDLVYSKSRKIFLWVVLVVRMLNTLNSQGRSTVDEMKAHLDQIPEDLDCLFAQIISRSMENRKECLILLQLVLLAFRTLTASETFFAVRYHNESEAWLHYRIPSPAQLERYILNTSRGLVELSRGKRPTLQFIHETVRSFLLSPAGLVHLDPALATNVIGLSHDAVKSFCARHTDRYEPIPYDRTLLETHKEFTERLEKEIPFLDYTVACTYRHADQAQGYGVDQTAFLAARRDENGKWQDHAARKWRDKLQYVVSRRYGKDSVSLVYFLAEHSLPNLVQLAANTGLDINAPSGTYGFPLQAASVAGYPRTVLALLQNGAEVNAHGGKHGSAWLAAFASRNYSVTTLLQEHGAIVALESLVPYLQKALKSSDPEAIEAVLKMSLAKDRLPANEDLDLHTLELAIASKNTGLVQFCLDRGAPLQAAGVLSLAVATNSPGIIQMIIDATKEPHVDLEFGALTVAIRKRFNGIIRLLIEYGAVVDPDSSPSEPHESPLLLAISSHQVYMLLNPSIDFSRAKRFTCKENCSGNILCYALAGHHYQSAISILSYAMQCGKVRDLSCADIWRHAVTLENDELITQIVNAGRDLAQLCRFSDVESGSGSTPSDSETCSKSILCMAIGQENIRSTISILRHASRATIEPSLLCVDVLRHAVDRGSVELFSELVDAGADLLAPGPPCLVSPCDGKIFCYALRSIKPDFAYAILQKAKTLSITSQMLCRNSLHISIALGDLRLIPQIIRAGADIDAPLDGVSPILHAVRLGKFRVVDCLIKLGATYNPQDLVSDAVKQYDSQILRGLLEDGADVNTKDSSGASLLHIATQCKRSLNVKILLQHNADMLTVDSEGRTAVDVLEQAWNDTMLHPFTERGPSYPPFGRGPSTECADILKAFTCTAIKTGHLELTARLVGPDFADSFVCFAAITTAAQEGQTEIARYLIEGYSSSMSEEHRFHEAVRAALGHALHNGHEEIAVMLRVYYNKHVQEISDGG